jgi:hypothetical protein
MKVKLMRTASRNSGGNGTFPETKMGLFRVYTEILEKKWDFSAKIGTFQNLCRQ